MTPKKVGLWGLSLTLLMVAGSIGCARPLPDAQTPKTAPRFDMATAADPLIAEQVGLVPPRYTLEPDFFTTYGLNGTRGDRRTQSSYGSMAGAIAGLTAEQLEAFHRGGDLFSKTFVDAEGYGPLFNADSCASCHQIGGIGGPGHEDVERMGMIDLVGADWMLTGEGFYPMPELGGPVRQARNDAGALERVPSQAEVNALADHLAMQGVHAGRFVITSARITTMVAGNGLLSAVSDTTLLTREALAKPFGITGHANRLSGMLGNINLTGRLGRLGLKAQLPDNKAFFADAAQQEMGLSNPDNPFEPSLNGPPVQVAQTNVSFQAAADFLAFCAGMAPPAPAGNEAAGAQAFAKAGCAVCHFSGYRTASQPSELPEELQAYAAALGNKPVPAYTDLLVHNMGRALADGFVQGTAKGGEWRTAPLWGLRYKNAFMHDGLSQSLEIAIGRHMSEGSEANEVVENYLGISTKNPLSNLTADERAALLRFLKQL